MGILINDEKVKKSLDLGFGFGSRFDVNTLSESFTVREKYRKGVSWHIPTDELIDLIISYGPIVSVGSGFANTESIIKERGGDIIATDINPSDSNGWCKDGQYKMDVEEISSISAVKKYSDRNVFMAWPPYDTPMAYDTVLAMEIGKYLIYIGEGNGGCNGDDRFFGELYANFEEVSEISIPQWDGIHDYCTVYKKIK